MPTLLRSLSPSGLACLALPALLALASPAPVFAPAVQETIPTVRQKDTKVEFPVRVDAVPTDAPDAKSAGVQHLVGTALRDKTIFGVDVYAYGLYLDPYAAQEHLAAWKGKSLKELQKDRGLYQAIYAGKPIPKTMRLVFVRNVDGEDVADAFEDSLAPRVKRAAAELELDDATEELAQFKTYFSLDKLRKGNELWISADASGQVTTRVAGQLMPPIQSQGLCWALMDTFVGDKPIEDRGKKELISLLPELLSKELPARPAGR